MLLRVAREDVVLGEECLLAVLALKVVPWTRGPSPALMGCVVAVARIGRWRTTSVLVGGSVGFVAMAGWFSMVPVITSVAIFMVARRIAGWVIVVISASFPAPGPTGIIVSAIFAATR